MRHVRCHECNKRYDFETNGFCPRCGAFTLPARGERIGIDGTVVRADRVRGAKPERRGHKNSLLVRGQGVEHKRPPQKVGARLPHSGGKAGLMFDLLDVLVDFFDT